MLLTKKVTDRLVTVTLCIFHLYWQVAIVILELFGYIWFEIFVAGATKGIYIHAEKTTTKLYKRVRPSPG